MLLQFVVVVRTLLLFSMVTAVVHIASSWSHGISSAPPRLEVVPGLLGKITLHRAGGSARTV